MKTTIVVLSVVLLAGGIASPAVLAQPGAEAVSGGEKGQEFSTMARECRQRVRSDPPMGEVARTCMAACIEATRTAPEGTAVSRENGTRCRAAHQAFSRVLYDSPEKAQIRAALASGTMPDVEGGLRLFVSATGRATVKLAKVDRHDWYSLCGQSAVVDDHGDFRSVDDRRATLKVRVSGIRLPPENEEGERPGECTAERLERVAVP